MEVEVLERMVLGAHGQAVLGRVGGDTVGNRPRGEHAVVLEAQVPVQAGGVVLLDDEPVPVLRGGAGLPRGLRRSVEIALGAVVTQLL